MIRRTGSGLSRRWRFAAILFAALGMVLLGVGTATAAPASQSNFTAQALHAGLTSTQAAALQARVDSYLAKAGGTQVAANEIQLASGAEVLLTLPGEKSARSLTAAPSGITPDASDVCWASSGTCCSYHYICGWSGEDGLGDVVTAYYCGVDVEVPNSFTTYGSYINNETAGVKAYFKNASHTTVYTTPKALYFDGAYNWHPIWYIDAC